MSDVITKNGKEFLPGDPRAYLVIFKAHGVLLGMSTLGGLKFRMDFPNMGDMDEDEEVMDSDASKIVNDLRYFFPKHRGDHMTTGLITEEDPEEILEFIHRANALMDETLDLTEIEAGVKSVSGSVTRSKAILDSLTESDMPQDLKEKQEHLKELKTQYEALVKEINAIHTELHEFASSKQEAAKKAVEEDPEMQAYDLAQATFRATTNKHTAESFAEAEKTCVLVQDEE